MTIVSARMLRIIFRGLLAYVILSFLGVTVLRMYVDYPCFSHLSEDGTCLERGGEIPHQPETDAHRIDIFLTTHSAGSSGGGCHWEHSQTDELAVVTSLGVFRLHLDGSILTVNDDTLEPGHVLQKTRLWHWNPWAIARAELRYEGTIPYCGPVETTARAVVTGQYGTHISILKGGAILLVILFGLRVTSRHVRSMTPGSSNQHGAV